MTSRAPTGGRLQLRPSSRADGRSRASCNEPFTPRQVVYSQFAGTSYLEIGLLSVPTQPSPRPLYVCCYIFTLQMCLTVMHGYFLIKAATIFMDVDILYSTIQYTSADKIHL